MCAQRPNALQRFTGIYVCALVRPSVFSLDFVSGEGDAGLREPDFVKRANANYLAVTMLHALTLASSV